MTILRDLPEDAANPTIAKGKFVKMLTDAWDKNYGDMTLKEQAGEVLSRAESLVKGVVGVPEEGLPSATRTKLMALVFAGAYFANLNDAKTEKYGTCGTSALCLHWPKWFSFIFDDPKGNNQAFNFGKEVKSNFNDLVMLEVKHLATTRVMRLNLISPCKTDMTVKAYNATSEKCKCKNYYGQDKIWFRLQKNFCKVDTTDVTADGGPYSLYPSRRHMPRDCEGQNIQHDHREGI
jgi:hypothetical protein